MGAWHLVDQNKDTHSYERDADERVKAVNRRDDGPADDGDDRRNRTEGNYDPATASETADQGPTASFPARTLESIASEAAADSWLIYMRGSTENRQSRFQSPVTRST